MAADDPALRSPAALDWSGGKVQRPDAESARRTLSGGMVEVPEPVFSLNREIIQRLTGFSVEADTLKAHVGYRHRRTPVRLESEERDGRLVIHNYGHGGAGVTLSWSCALKAARMAGYSLRSGSECSAQSSSARLILREIAGLVESA